MIRNVLLATMLSLSTCQIYGQSTLSKGSVFHTIGSDYAHPRTHSCQNELTDSLDIEDSIDEKNVCTPSADSIRAYLPLVSLPLKSIMVNSPFGMRRDPMNRKRNRFHSGVDLAAKYESVYSVLPGTVSAAGYSENGGNYITVDHGVCFCSYLHLSKIGVCKGQHVNAGQVIGVSGNSGRRTTGAHLHFSVRYNDSRGKKYFNPMLILGFVKEQLLQYQQSQ